MSRRRRAIARLDSARLTDRRAGAFFRTAAFLRAAGRLVAVLRAGRCVRFFAVLPRLAAAAFLLGFLVAGFFLDLDLVFAPPPVRFLAAMTHPPSSPPTIVRPIATAAPTT
jgi:hypothetical protein